MGGEWGRRNIKRKISISFYPVLVDMRKPRELYIYAKYHVTARINRGEFALESKEIKELFLQTVMRAKKKYSFQLRSFTIMDNHIPVYFTQLLITD